MLIPLGKLGRRAVHLKPSDLLPRVGFSQLHTPPGMQHRATLGTRATFHSKDTTSKTSIQVSQTVVL